MSTIVEATRRHSPILTWFLRCTIALLVLVAVRLCLALAIMGVSATVGHGDFSWIRTIVAVVIATLFVVQFVATVASLLMAAVLLGLTVQLTVPLSFAFLTVRRPNAPITDSEVPAP